MKLYTHIPQPTPDFSINHHSVGVSIGSCFATNIAQHLQHDGFSIVANPLGVVYNPASIERTIAILTQRKELREQDFFQTSDYRWNSYYLHSSCAASSPQLALKQLSKKQQEFMAALSTAQYAIITLGTAWVYEHAQTKEIVTNCHKQPENIFTRYKMSVDDIVCAIQKSIQYLKQLRADIRIILTISPIRHLRDGAFENTISKSALFLALERLLQIPNTYYFSAYEYMMDELRDYRFYAEDLIHPSTVAVQYIYNKFADAFYSDATKLIAKQSNGIKKFLNHTFFTAPNEHTKRTIQNYINTCKTLIETYPQACLTDELEKLNLLLKS